MLVTRSLRISQRISKQALVAQRTSPLGIFTSNSAGAPGRSMATAVFTMAAKQRAIQTIDLDPAKIQKLEHIQITEINVPEAGEGEVLVKMQLRPVNPTDIAQAKGLYGEKPVFTVGSEGVGTVEKTGPGASKFKQGQRVVAAGWGVGTWQQYISIPESKLLAVPDELDDRTASQFYINPITVLGLTEVSAVPKGGWLLQTAAGSHPELCVGCYSAAAAAVCISFGPSGLEKLNTSVLARQIIQYAKHIGIRTVNVVRRDEQIEELKALGADEVINMEKEDLVKRVKEITGGKGVDAAVDPVGGELVSKVLQTVKRGGSLQLFGTLSGGEFTARTRDLIAGRSLGGFIIYTWLPGLGEEESRKRQETALQLLKDKVITPLNGKVFQLDQYKEAIQESIKPGRGAKVFLQ